MQWNTGRSYKLDRARHNKSEEYEVPVNKRKRRFKSGGTLVDDKKAMVLSQIKEVHHHADELAKVLANMDTVDAWVVGKMERATTDLSDITHYLDGTTEYAKGGMMSDEMMSQKKVLFYRNKLVQMNVGKDSSALDFAIRIIDSMVDKDDEDYVFLTSLQNNKKALFYRNKLVQMNVGKNSSALDFAIKLIDMAYDGELKMAKGGKLKKSNEEGINLFEDYENIPPKVQRILDKHEEAFEDGDYKELEVALKELKKIGYTFEYGLDGMAYDLRPIGTKGKSEFMDYADGGMMADGGINNEYFSKQASMKGGIDYYSVDIDTEDGDEIRDLEFKSYSAAKKAYDKYKKSMKYNGETIEDIQLICNYKNGDYDSIGYVGKYNEMTEGQSILLKSIPNPIYERFYNKEVVIEELNGNKITKAFVRNTGEKVPFVIDLNTFKVEKYASGGMMAKGGEVKSKIKKYQILSPDGITIEREVPYYTSKNKAMSAFDRWKENYSRQGYYSSVRYGRIHLSDLEDYCQFITL